MENTATIVPIDRVGDGGETVVEVLSVNKRIKTVKDYIAVGSIMNGINLAARKVKRWQL